MALGLASCASSSAVPWPEADSLFRGAELWHGGDSAYSVDLGGGRVLWLFGDSLVGPVATPGTRAGSRMVRNSIAVQEGYDPLTASIRFYYDDSGDEPAEFLSIGHLARSPNFLSIGHLARSPNFLSIGHLARSPAFLSIGLLSCFPHFLSIGHLACSLNLLRAIHGTHPSGLLRCESSPPGYDYFAPPEEGTWRWPGPGVRSGAKLLLGTTLLVEDEGGLGFRTVGSEALLIANPDDEPPGWKLQRVPFPEQGLGVQLGLGAWMVHDEHLYAYAPVEPGTHDIYLARWRLADAVAGGLERSEWWAGEDWAMEWTRAVVLVAAAQTEFSVHRAADGTFVMLSVDGFGGANIVVRRAARPQGPWSEPSRLFRPELSDREGVLVYSAKAHPELEGASIVITWCTNHLDFWTMTADQEIYFPRFLRWSDE